MLKEIPVLVAGGGVAGLSAAVNLVRWGGGVLLVEKNGALGGAARGYACKAVDECVLCGACRLGDLLAEATARSELEILTRADIYSVQPGKGAWRIELAPCPGEAPPWPRAGGPLKHRQVVQARAVILAVGHAPFDPRGKTRFGYGRVPGVVSVLEVEAGLEAGGLGLEQEGGPRRIAFIQCVGSRDEALGRPYCSRICCKLSLNLASKIKAISPQAEITFFYMDQQNYGPAWHKALAQAQERFRFVRAIPGEVCRAEHRPRVIFADENGAVKREDFDLVVLTQGIQPPPDAVRLSELFGLARTVDGFLGQDHELTAAGPAGIFVAGSARGPRGIVESIDHGAAAAAAARAFLAAPGQAASHV